MRRIFGTQSCSSTSWKRTRYGRRAFFELLAISRRHGDLLLTSYLAIGELLTGAQAAKDGEVHRAIQETVSQIGFNLLPFDAMAVEPFAMLRSRERLRVADAIHLACAAAASVDLFITGDKALTKLHVPGIKFIRGLDTR